MKCKVVDCGVMSLYITPSAKSDTIKLIIDFGCYDVQYDMIITLK